MTEIAKGVEWLHVYYVRGSSPKGWVPRTVIQDPPSSGWTLAFVMRDTKHSEILCPYTLQAYRVPTDCSEVAKAKEPPQAFRPEWTEAFMRKRWADCVSRGWQRDYDVAARLMKKMGWEVPTSAPTDEKGETKLRGGNEAAEALLKPVKAKGKRGKFLKWFMEGGGSRAVRDAMAQFDTTRSNVLSYLYMLWKDHGIGYVLKGEVATITVPQCASPFDDGSVVVGFGGVIEATAATDIRAGDPVSIVEDDWLEGPAEDDWLDAGGGGAIGLSDTTTETQDSAKGTTDEDNSWLD